MKFYQTPIANWLQGAVPGAVSRLPVADRSIYLTFDDGPHPNSTPLLLEALKAADVQATHFLLGERAQAYPDGVAQLLAAGQRIANHAWTHDSPWRQSADEVVASAHQTLALLQQHIDTDTAPIGPMWYRPPYGHLHPLAIQRLNHRLKIALWSIMPGDFDPDVSPEALVELTLQQAAPGKIIVLHDSPKAWPRLAKALPQILQGLTDQGYIIRALP